MGELELSDLRLSVDNIDSALVFLLAERFRVTGKIGAVKREKQLPAIDHERERSHMARIEELAESSGLSRDFAHRLFRAILDEVVARHKQQLNSG
jgi:chorismate mutase